MYQVRLKAGNKEVANLEFPETPEEIKLSRYIDFDIAFQKKQAWESEQDDKILDMKYRLGYTRHVLDILSEFTGCKDIDMVKTGSYEKHLLKLLGIKKIADLDIDTTEETLYTLFANVWRVISSYKPSNHIGDYEFEYKGEKYRIPTIYRDAITKKEVFEDIPAGPAIEAMEVIRAWEDNINNDKTGSIRFTSVLKIVAIFSRKDGESFPTSQEGVERFISDRVVHFGDIDMKTALDIETFFFGITSR